LLSHSQPEKSGSANLSHNFHKPAGKSLSRRLTSLPVAQLDPSLDSSDGRSISLYTSSAMPVLVTANA